MASNQTKSGYLASLNRAINDPTNPFLPTSDPLTNHALAHINWHSIVLADLFNKREEAKTSMDEASTEIKELEAELRPIQTQISNKKHLVQTAASQLRNVQSSIPNTANRGMSLAEQNGLQVQVAVATGKMVAAGEEYAGILTKWRPTERALLKEIIQHRQQGRDYTGTYSDIQQVFRPMHLQRSELYKKLCTWRTVATNLGNTASQSSQEEASKEASEEASKETPEEAFSIPTSLTDCAKDIIAYFGFHYAHIVGADGGLTAVEAGEKPITMSELAAQGYVIAMLEGLAETREQGGKGMTEAQKAAIVKRDAEKAEASLREAAASLGMDVDEMEKKADEMAFYEPPVTE